MYKRIILGIIVGTMTLLMTACGQKNNSSSSQTVTSGQTVEQVEFNGSGNNNNKVLVAYFSYFDNTDADKITTKKYADAMSSASVTIVNGKRRGNNDVVADILKEKTGADIFSILTAEQYSPDYDAGIVEQAMEDGKNKIKPQLASHLSDLEQYDTVILLFPTWWYDMPMAVYTFFDEYDFSGKTIAPIATSGGSGLVNTISSIKKLEPNATVSEGLEIYQANVADSGSDISKWLTKVGIPKK